MLREDGSLNLADLAEPFAGEPKVPEEDTGPTRLSIESLGKSRAQAIQDALLSNGQVDPSRVFVITADARPAVAAESRVRMELSLK